MMTREEKSHATVSFKAWALLLLPHADPAGTQGPPGNMEELQKKRAAYSVVKSVKRDVRQWFLATLGSALQWKEQQRRRNPNPAGVIAKP